MNKTAISLLAGLIIGSMALTATGGTNSGAEAVVTGGWSSAPIDDARVKAAAQHAVAAQSAATKTELKLAAIQTAQQQVVAGMNYKLTLSVLKNGKQQPAQAVVWAKLDGSYKLTEWSWK